MPRSARIAPGGYVYHVLNRAVARLPLFEKAADYAAFEAVLAQAHERFPIRIIAYCVMPNHWHMVLWPREDGELTTFVRWLTHTHTMRWHAHHNTAGTGHLYQGRFKSFPIQTDEHFLTVCRYVERNALRAKLTAAAEQWRWGSLWHRQANDTFAQNLLSRWPVDPPDGWVKLVNEPQTAAELDCLRRSVKRGSPYGSAIWQNRLANRLGMQSTLRPLGRPRNNRPNQ